MSLAADDLTTLVNSFHPSAALYSAMLRFDNGEMYRVIPLLLGK